MIEVTISKEVHRLIQCIKLSDKNIVSHKIFPEHMTLENAKHIIIIAFVAIWIATRSNK